MPGTQQRVYLDGPAGPLEALIEEGAADHPWYGVICHPHPLRGGTMDNKVVTTLARTLHERGIPTVRFNFRGVGGSGGRYGEGTGEIADAAAVADWGAQRWPGRGLLLAGFSFGGYVALRLALVRATARLITVAPAVTLFESLLPVSPACPWLIVQGDADEVIDAEAVMGFAAQVKPAPHLIMLPGVGHFFHGKLAQLREAVNTAL